MQIYKIKDDQLLEDILEKPFKLEKELQKICEKNLEQVFGLKFVRSEYTIGQFRIDTLAFDEINKSFVIIEYKKDKNFSVIDQGYAYLSNMLNNKAEVILEYNENNKNTLKRDEVDWSQSKVIFITHSFTEYQKQAVNFRDLPIELWEVKRFSSGLLTFNQIESPKNNESIKTISSGDADKNLVNKEITLYTEEKHLDYADEEIKELYEKFKSMLLNMDERFTIKITKLYIAFNINKRNIVCITIIKSGLKCWINLKKGELDDYKNIFMDMSNKGHWGNGDYETKIENDENLEYILSLVKQAINIIKENYL